MSPEPKPDTYSRDGVMRGVLAPTKARRKVGIVATGGWSGWHAVAAGLGWDIAWVAVGEGQLGELWKQELTAQNICHVPMTGLSKTLVVTSEIEMLLFEERIPLKTSPLWKSATLQAVIGNSLPRRSGAPTGWTQKPLNWRHSNCGGVTGATGVLHCLSRDASQLGSLKIPTLPRRQLSSILSTTEGGRSIPSPVPAIWPPQVTPSVCPKGLTGVHGDGLLPVSRSTSWVDMPDCLSRTGWVRRKLNSKEFLTALDVPMDSQDSTLIQSKIFQKDLLFRTPIGVLRLVGEQFNFMLALASAEPSGKHGGLSNANAALAPLVLLREDPSGVYCGLSTSEAAVAQLDLLSEEPSRHSGGLSNAYSAGGGPILIRIRLQNGSSVSTMTT